MGTWVHNTHTITYLAVDSTAVIVHIIDGLTHSTRNLVWHTAQHTAKPACCCYCCCCCCYWCSTHPVTCNKRVAPCMHLCALLSPGLTHCPSASARWFTCCCCLEERRSTHSPSSGWGRLCSGCALLVTAVVCDRALQERLTAPEDCSWAQARNAQPWPHSTVLFYPIPLSRTKGRFGEVRKRFTELQT